MLCVCVFAVGLYNIHGLLSTGAVAFARSDLVHLAAAARCRQAAPSQAGPMTQVGSGGCEVDLDEEGRG